MGEDTRKSNRASDEKFIWRIKNQNSDSNKIIIKIKQPHPKMGEGLE